MDAGNWIALAAVAIALVVGFVNVKQASDSAAQAKRSADSAEKSLDLSQKQLESSVAAQAESRKLAQAQLETSTAAQNESLRLAKEQLDNSVKAHTDSLQPYVWADIKAREDGSGMMIFVLGNSGPTVATDVRVAFHPALDHIVPPREVAEAQGIQKLLETGVKSLTPGRVFTWTLGVTHEYFSKEALPPASGLTLTITGNGPHGPMPESSYTIELNDHREQSLRPVGLGLVEKPLKAVEQRLKDIAGNLDKIRRAIPQGESTPGRLFT